MWWPNVPLPIYAPWDDISTPNAWHRPNLGVECSIGVGTFSDLHQGCQHQVSTLLDLQTHPVVCLVKIVWNEWGNTCHWETIFVTEQWQLGNSKPFFSMDEKKQANMSILVPKNCISKNATFGLNVNETFPFWRNEAILAFWAWFQHEIHEFQSKFVEESKSTENGKPNFVPKKIDLNT